MRDDASNGSGPSISNLRVIGPFILVWFAVMFLLPWGVAAIERETMHVYTREMVVENSLKELEKGVQLFRLEMGRLPFRLEELSTPTEEWPEAWLWEMPADPWKGEIYYRITETGFLVGSTGPDRKKGTEDDIVFESP